MSSNQSNTSTYQNKEGAAKRLTEVHSDIKKRGKRFTYDGSKDDPLTSNDIKFKNDLLDYQKELKTISSYDDHQLGSALRGVSEGVDWYLKEIAEHRE